MLLEVAAMLHDIGWSRAMTKGHNKHSRDMILEADLQGLSAGDRLLCALAARYHRKAEPDASRHRRFASLDARDRNVVEWLGGIIRVADGLDRSHLGAVESISCEIGTETIVFHLTGSGIHGEDLFGARRKMALLERKTERTIEYKPC
jgi:exopolyphosphatase/guanosine-5'-triphosphate,3'-diphosphate pyrophosphatase